MNKIYRVDDGAFHWVIAANEEDAVAVWRDHMVNDLGIDPDTELDLDGPPAVELVPFEKAATVNVYEDGDVVSTMLREYESDSSRNYVGCSEW